MALSGESNKNTITAQEWLSGARMRTLPAAIAPVILGTAAANRLGSMHTSFALLACVVALGLQIGTNFANDYSDGIRGTDDNRVGPQRITSTHPSSARAVLIAALTCFAISALAGITLVALSSQWWLLLCGGLAVLAAWFYTGGSHPYGYLGIGISEVLVFIFFGLMATVGTTWVQALNAPWWVWCLGAAMGVESMAMLMINNIRDIPTDTASHKVTLAVRLGQRASRFTQTVMVILGVILTFIPLPAPWYLRLLGFLLTMLIALRVIRATHHQTDDGDLIGALRDTGFTLLSCALLGSLILTTTNLA